MNFFKELLLLLTKAIWPQIILLFYTNLVHVQQGEKFLNLLWSNEVLLCNMPVCSSHLVLHLIHPGWCWSDANTPGLVEAHRLNTETLKLHRSYDLTLTGTGYITSTNQSNHNQGTLYVPIT